MAAMTTLWQGREQLASLSPADRGFQYGDGFFTTMLFLEDRVINWEAHWRRLTQSAQRLAFPKLNFADIHFAVQQSLDALFSEQVDASKSSFVVKLIFSRGQGGRGYLPPAESVVTLMVQLSPAPISIESDPARQNLLLSILCMPPLTVSLCQTESAVQSQLAGIKHLNRLENVLARTEVTARAEEEGIMLNALGEVVGGTQSNLVVVKDKVLLTPALTHSGVEGTARFQLSQLAQGWGYGWQETNLSEADLFDGEELFLINAVRGIMPIRRLQGREFSIIVGEQLQAKWRQWQLEHAQPWSTLVDDQSAKS